MISTRMGSGTPKQFQMLGIEPVFFLGEARIFPYVLVVSDVWKGFGFGTVVYLAALTAIDPQLYEAAVVDGAGRGIAGARVDASRACLPENTLWVPITGGNHAQFGWYGEQSGDNPAQISRSEQQDQIVAATTAFLEGLR